MSDDAAILRARARALARPPELGPDPAGLIEVLEFRLGDERYALDTACVREVYPLVGLTKVPCTPSFVAGIVNVRGRIVPVLDFKKLFELPERGLTDLHRVILLQGNGIEFGLLADATVAVRAIAIDTLQPKPTGIRGEYVTGVTPDRLVVLDGGRILADPKILVNHQVEI